MKEPKFAYIDAHQIQCYDAKAVALWREYLQRFDVRFPKKNTSQERLWVAILLLLHDQHKGAYIHKDDICILARKVNPDLGLDQQVRHLKRSGWNLESDPKRKGWYRFYNPHTPSPEHTANQLRKTSITTDDFDQLKRVYSNRCATCGAEEGKPSTRYGSQDLVVLQRGHMDPSREGSVGNILPQCQFCNRAYKDDFTFDDKGRVRAVASVRPVRLASQKVKRMIYNFLKQHFKE